MNKKVLVVAGCVLAIALAGVMLLRSGSAPVVDQKVIDANAKATEEQLKDSSAANAEPEKPSGFTKKGQKN